MNSKKWIDSNGGPLVLVPDQLLEKWNGIDGDDYARACAVKDYIAPIALANSSVLVLGDCPDLTTDVETDEGPALIRWLYADSEAGMLNSLPAANDVNVCDEFEFVVEHEDHFLIDSAFPGTEAPDRLEFRLRKARYKVVTKEVLRDRVGFRLHIFTWVSCR